MKHFYYNSNNIVSDLYRGVSSLIARQTVAWVFFLQADLFMKTKIRKFYEIKDNEIIPTRFLVPTSMILAVISTVIIMPLDNLKTNKQLY